MKILVTGSNGTIGTRLMEFLVKNNHDVVGLDIRKNLWNKQVDKLTKTIDLRDENNLEKLDKDFDLIIHLAANPYVYLSVVNPVLAHDNHNMTFNILEFARKNNIKKLIFASSRETYGNIDKEIINEEDVRIKNCESPYTSSKIGSEALVHAYTKCYGIDHIIIRFSNVYGMYDGSHRVVPNFIRRAKDNQDLEVYGEEKSLDFTYIDDSIKGVISCVNNFDRAKNNTFNISGGEICSILKIAELIKKNMNSNSKINIKQSKIGEVKKYCADLTKMKTFLGFDPNTKIEDGIKKSIEWYKSVGFKEIKVL
ncbi:NAD-dependent epimerase/dehydratase family protein [Candidatus Woesearchaeota archaeon]|nr:NAD-dependent epimerase/dehydratase family protein [Candidatus Woesearchaeota archaeon]